MNCFTAVEEVSNNLSANEFGDCQTIMMSLQGLLLSSCSDLPMDLKRAESDRDHNLALWFTPTSGHKIEGVLNVVQNIQCVGRGNGQSSGFQAVESDGCVKLIFPHYQ